MSGLPEIVLDQEACNLFELYRSETDRLRRYHLWKDFARAEASDVYSVWFEARLQEWSDLVGWDPAPCKHGTTREHRRPVVSEEENEHFDAFLIQYVTRTQEPK